MENINKNHIVTHGGRMWGVLLNGESIYDKVINADVNDAFYRPSPEVIRSIQQWVKTINHSPDSSCVSLKKKLSVYHDIDTELIEIGSGSSDLLQAIIIGFLDPGDKVVSLDPTYAEYERCVNWARGELVKIVLKESDNFTHSLDDILDALRCNPRLLVLCNPNNPTGQVIKKKDVEIILQRLDRQSFLLIDEAYIDFCPEESMISEVKNWPNLIITRTFSKVYALAGLRVGYAVLGDLADQIFSSVIRPPWPVSTISIKAAEAALEDRAYVDEMIATTLRLREEFAKSLNQFSQFRVIPSKTNFFLVGIEGTGRSSYELSQSLEEGMIFVRDCSSFGKTLGDRYIRLTTQYATSNELIINAIHKAVQQ